MKKNQKWRKWKGGALQIFVYRYLIDEEGEMDIHCLHTKILLTMTLM